MPVPETTIDEDHGVKMWKHQVGATRQVSTVKAKAESARVESTAQQHLWFSVLATDTAHVEPPLHRCQNVGHNFVAIIL